MQNKHIKFSIPKKLHAPLAKRLKHLRITEEQYWLALIQSDLTTWETGGKTAFD